VKAGSINLQKLFEQTIRYRIPLFQRPYVWKEKENWRPIWDDLRSLAERLLRTGSTSPHFLGAIVLDQVLNQTGEIESRQVIDGQQRLTTLQLMLTAFGDLAVAHGLEKFAKRFEKLTENDESFCVNEDDVFKVWPTNRDRAHFRRVTTSGSLENVCKSFKLSPDTKKLEIKIPGAYIYFYRSANEWLTRELTDHHGKKIETTVDARFDAIWNVVRSHLLLVVIDLEEDDDAQVIFETLNTRGTQLLPADLVKNFLFQMAEKDGAHLDDLYAKHWKGFDSDFWREEIRQGRLKRPRIDLFLQHYLTLKTSDEVPVTHVFACFKTYVEDSTRQLLGNDYSGGIAAYHLEQLNIYGKIFKQLLTTNPETRLGVFFERLAAVDTATVYPLLLEAFHDLHELSSRSELKRLVRDIESFLVRRMICGLTSKNYNRFFLEMIRDCRRDGKISADAARKFLSKADGDSVRWPSNKEVRVAMLELPLYRKLSRKKLRMLLLALEGQLEDGKTEPVIYTDADNFTIEHIMPQSWTKHWPLLFEDYPEDDEASLTEWRNGKLHTIGNLTLLTKKLNPALSARDWDYKQANILASSKMNLNRYFIGIENWNEDWIYERSTELCKLAERIWPHPRQVVSSEASEGEQ